MSFIENLWARLHKACQQYLPGNCNLCASPTDNSNSPGLCSGCLYDLPFINQQQRCLICGLGLASSGSHCGQCLHQPPNFSRSYIPFAYEYPLDRLIQGFKYRRQFANGELLGHLLVDHLDFCAREEPDWQWPDLIIPAPMHRTRRWTRGFNQADLIARPIGNHLSIPLASRLISRRARTPSQQGLNREQRQRNLRNAFAISNPSRVAGKRIALVDDVVTTTATMRELSRLLRKAGATDVQVWALARTPHT